MTRHGSAIRILAAEQSPIGVAATHMLAELDTDRAEIARLTEENRVLLERITLGGVPPRVSAVVYERSELRRGLL